MYQDILTKLRLFGKPSGEVAQLTFLSGIIVLVALGAFGLGRFSGLEEAKGRLQVYAPLAPASNASGQGAQPVVAQLATPVAAAGTKPADMKNSGNSEPSHNFVASKNGSKYYSAGCSGASRIKAANQVWFTSSADAETAGYTLASGCNK